MTRRVETILDAMADERLFARWFSGDSWKPWRAALASIFGLDMDQEGLDLYRRCTGRTEAPRGPFSEVWLCIGRRGGKSLALALIAVWLATCKDWRPYLVPGERGIIMCLAKDRAQAAVILNYIKALILETPALAELVERETAEAVHLARNVSVEVHACNFKSIRGRTLICALADEAAFWQVDGANPDAEVLTALRPAMATVRGSMMLLASSPYSKTGELYRAWKRHYGRDDSPILFWKAPSTVMNPSLPQRVVDEALAEDHEAAKAEWLAEFRADLVAFVDRAVVEGCVVSGRRELPPLRDVRYQGFVDPSGGSSDSMTLAIGHLDKERIILDAIRERIPPFSPESVVDEFASLLKAYRVSSVVGDRYAGEWPRERFKRAGIQYLAAAAPKNDLYRDMLPTLNSGQIELLDQVKLVNQICGLERRTARGGRDSIDHAPHAHDDIANAAAGVVSICRKPKRHGPRVSRLGEGHQGHNQRRGVSEGAVGWDGSGSFGGFIRNG